MGRCQAATNLGSLGDSARLSWGEGDLQGFDNGVNGRNDIKGKVAREAASKCGQRASFNGDRGSGRHGREARRVSRWEFANGAGGNRAT